MTPKVESFDHRGLASIERERHADDDHDSEDALLKIGVNCDHVHAIFHDAQYKGAAAGRLARVEPRHSSVWLRPRSKALLSASPGWTRCG